MGSLRRRSPIVFLLAVTCMGAYCREAEITDRPATAPVANDIPAPTPPTVHDVAAAVRVADEKVESARILALPVDRLPAADIRGIALPTYSELPDLTYAQMLERIRSTGANYVSIVFSWDQQTIYHNRLRPNPSSTPPDEKIGQLVDTAHRLGLKVMLFPIVHIARRDPGEWRGKLHPTDPKRWRHEYAAYIEHYAGVAAKYQADLLSVGSELSSEESATRWWRRLIASVRAKYHGKLVYSANWDHYTVPAFWPDLDYVGVSSYFEVAKSGSEPIFQVTEKWLQYRKKLIAFAHRQHRPLVLTEVGYPTVETAAVKPWDYTIRTAPDPNAQLAAFASLVTAWDLSPHDDTNFGGLFIWHGWGHGGPTDVGYPIWGKSSETLVRRWYGGNTAQ